MARVRDQLSSLGIRPNKRRGQNFLIDSAVLDDLMAFSPLPGYSESQSCSVVELGPGLGALTERLVQAPNFAAVEIETEFCQHLRDKHAGINVVQGDARNVDLRQFGNNQIVYGNLPYSFSTDILFHVLEYVDVVRRATFLLQREFVERLAAGPGGRDYGVISVMLQVWATVRSGRVVSGNCFHPPTAVESQLVELTFSQTPRVEISDLDWFRRVVRASFQQRRKKLYNSLKGAHLVEPQELAACLEKCAIDGGRRAETLSLAEFGALARELRRD